jgi:hypothetical protein
VYILYTTYVRTHALSCSRAVRSAQTRSNVNMMFSIPCLNAVVGVPPDIMGVGKSTFYLYSFLYFILDSFESMNPGNHTTAGTNLTSLIFITF